MATTEQLSLSQQRLVQTLKNAGETPVFRAFRAVGEAFNSADRLDEQVVASLQQIGDAMYSGGDALSPTKELWEYSAAIGYTQHSSINDTLRDLLKIAGKKATVVVAVEGGVVQGASADSPDVAIIVRDFDNIKGGDEDPLGGKDCDAAGYPYSIY